MADETYSGRRDRLHTSPRLRALEGILSELEHGLDPALPAKTRSLNLLVVDALLDGDDEALNVAVTGLQRVQGRLWADVESAELANRRGRVEQLIETGLLGLERVLPVSTLADLEGGET